MLDLLDNIVWHALTGAQSRFAAGAGGARRYARGFSPILGFANLRQPDFAALDPFCTHGEHFYCDGWSQATPAGWQLDVESTMFKMVWDAPMPEGDIAPAAVPLEARHAAAALALATLTRPGPFGLRTIELGDYFGIFDGDRLVAMAGERMAAGRLREISGVCTLPERQGEGLARGLMLKLVQRELARGETPFLHVMRDNERAREIYRRMGFRDYAESVVRVVRRL